MGVAGLSVEVLAVSPASLGLEAVSLLVVEFAKKLGIGEEAVFSPAVEAGGTLKKSEPNDEPVVVVVDGLEGSPVGVPEVEGFVAEALVPSDVLLNKLNADAMDM